MDSDTAMATTTQAPSISVTKTPKNATVTNDGNTVAYTFVITNTGTCRPHSVSISDVLSLHRPSGALFTTRTTAERRLDRLGACRL